MDGLFLPWDGVFEAAAGVEIVDDREDGDGSDVEWVGGVLCFGKGCDGSKVTGGRPGGVSGFDGVVEVGEVSKPLFW